MPSPSTHQDSPEGRCGGSKVLRLKEGEHEPAYPCPGCSDCASKLESSWPALWIQRGDPLNPETWAIWGSAENPEVVPHEIDGCHRYIPVSALLSNEVLARVSEVLWPGSPVPAKTKHNGARLALQAAIEQAGGAK